MDMEITKALYQNAAGELAVKYMEALEPGAVLPLAESKALALLGEIKAILDDETLEDPACFRRIDALAEAFRRSGVPTDRHDW